MAHNRYNPNRQCVGKICYPNKDAAKYVAKRGENNGLGRIRAYRCPWCDGWHLGHKPPTAGDLARLQRLDDTLT